MGKPQNNSVPARGGWWQQQEEVLPLQPPAGKHRGERREGERGLSTGGTEAAAQGRVQTLVLTIRVLLSRGPGVRLALGGTNRARSGEAGAHLPCQRQPGLCCHSFPRFPFLFFFFLGFCIAAFIPRHCPNPWPGAPDPHPGLFGLEGVPGKPAHPDSDSLEKGSAGREGSKEGDCCCL